MNGKYHLSHYSSVKKNMKALIAVLLLAANIIFAQGKWQGLNPYPADVYLYRVQPVTDNTILACGISGTFLRSTDSGESWKVTKLTDITAIRGISFIDSLNGFIIDSKKLKQTNDGGSTWNNISLNIDFSQYYLSDIISFEKISYLFVSSSAASLQSLINANSFVLKSTDNGNTWKVLDYEIKGVIGSAYFINSNTGFFSTEERISINESNYYLHKTLDGGNSWQKIQLNADAKCIYFLNEISGFAGRYRTGNGGLTWTDAFKDSLSAENLEAIDFYDSLKGCALTEQKILETSDGGLTWTVKDKPALHVFTDVSFSKNGTAWIAGWGCDIRRRKTNESNYLQLSKGPRNDFFGVFFLNKEEGWISGSNGIILHSKDGGVSWEEQNTNLTATLSKLKFLNSMDGWALGYNAVLNTTNGGSDWTIRKDLKVWFPNIEFFDEDNGILSDAGGNVLRTTNKGKDWTALPGSPFPYALGPIAITNRTGAMILSSGGLLHVSDKGASAKWYAMPELSEAKTIQFIDSTNGFILTEKSRILATTDGGWTWKEIPGTVGLNKGPINRLCMLDKTNGYIAWLNNYISRITIDQTLIIEEQDDYGVTNVSDFYFLNKDHGWAVGSDGNIIQYTTDNSSSVSDNKNESSTAISNPLSLRGAYIKFVLQAPQHVKINLYNALGRKVSTIYSGWLNRGENNINWRTGRLPSGVYLISLECAEFVRVVKSFYVH